VFVKLPRAPASKFDQHSATVNGEDNEQGTLDACGLLDALTILPCVALHFNFNTPMDHSQLPLGHDTHGNAVEVASAKAPD
jgi:hypothetical protein